MLYNFASSFGDEISGLNVLVYISFRAMAAFSLALLLVVIFQPRFIAWFRNRQLGQPIRDDGPQSHLSKSGTPTMGGLVVVLSVILTSILLVDLREPVLWVTLLVISGYAVLGFFDDYRKVKKKDSGGISARGKLFFQILVAVAGLGLLLVLKPDFPTTLQLPFFKEQTIELGWLWLPFAALVIVGSSNAVNLTDGLDGLVTGPLMTCALAYGVFAYVTGNVILADYLNISYVPGVGELAIVAAAIIASGLGFLWFNAFPAQVFMGDVGSLSLGGALGVIAVITKHELVLVIAGGVFVVEALSVIAQVTSFKLTGKRVLRMAPIHHHYELKGLAEPKIIVRAWILSIVLAVIAVATLKLR